MTTENEPELARRCSGVLRTEDEMDASMKSPWEVMRAVRGVMKAVPSEDLAWKSAWRERRCVERNDEGKTSVMGILR